MKKRMMKLAALGFAAALTFGTSVPALASTITLPNSTGHTYDVYQIFTATVTTEGEGEDAEQVLSDVKWGQNGTGTKDTLVDSATLTALEEAAKLTSDSAKLEVIQKYASLDEESAIAKDVNAGEKITLADGY